MKERYMKLKENPALLRIFLTNAECISKLCFHNGVTGSRTAVTLPSTGRSLGNEVNLRSLCGWKLHAKQKKKRKRKKMLYLTASKSIFFFSIAGVLEQKHSVN